MTARDVIQGALCDKHCQCAPHWHVTQCESKTDAILAALAGAGFAVVPLGGALDALGYLRWTVTACRRCGYERQECHCATGFAAPQPAREGGE